MKLYDCVIHRDLASLKEAFASGADPNETVNDSPVLHTVVEHDWTDGLAEFISAGADLNLVNDRGDTPLMVGVIHKKAISVRTLLENGADPELVNAIGSTPFNYVVRMNAGLEMTVSSFVLEDGVKKEIVHDSGVPRQAALSVLQELALGGASVDAEDNRGFTALHTAASTGDMDFLVAVLDAGADVDHANSEGYCALHAASAGGHLEAVRAMLSCGANPSVADNSGFTPLHDAAASGNLALIKVLLGYGADAGARVTAGWEDITAGMTPADVAALKGHAEAVSMLASTY